MATYRKRGKRWRVEICVNGIRSSETFATKAECAQWALTKEHDLAVGSGRGGIVKRTLNQAIEKYLREVAPKKPGFRWERIRLAKFVRDLDFIGDLLYEIQPAQISAWRDYRLTVVKPGTVNRDLNLLSAVFEAARRDWHWLNDNPVHDVRRPRNAKARDRLISGDEIKLILSALGYADGATIKTVKQRLAVAFLFSIETALRIGELTSLDWTDIYIEKRYLHLDKTKNGDERDVPLSMEAMRLLALLPTDSKSVFSLKKGSCDTMFRKARALAAVVYPAIKTLHWHDTRHEATTRLARKIDVLDLARMIGHRDLKSLMIYYNPKATDIALRLD